MTNDHSGSTFPDLIASRKAWIESVLKPWARQASRADLRLAEQEWTDIAGKVDADKTLWAWAWGRFPDLVHGDLGIDEAAEVAVHMRDGRSFRGYPDARQSQNGQLVLIGRNATGDAFAKLGPFSIDEIAAIVKS
jgi:hypothetical protein